ncbi:GNAT family N-acetyltransferase [Sulfitobacter sp. LCG007]
MKGKQDCDLVPDMESIRIRPFEASDRDWLVARHEALYARDEGFDASFGRLVSQILDDFIAEHDAVREAGWIAEDKGGRLGSIFCVALDAHVAKLRLFLLEPEARGQGLGRRMLETCTDFARSCGYREMQLWTHESHQAACRLYASNGWQLIAATPVRNFGVDNIEQHWSRTL